MRRSSVMTDTKQQWQDANRVTCRSFIAQNLRDPRDGSVYLEDSVGGAKPSSTDIAGYVSLVIQGQEMLGPDTWDLVVLFWEYFPNYLEEFAQHGQMTISYPDQPLRLSVNRIGNKLVRVKLHLEQPRSEVCSESLLIHAMCDEALRVIEHCSAKQLLSGSNDLVDRIRRSMSRI